MGQTGYRARISLERKRALVIEAWELVGAYRDLVDAYESGRPERILEKREALSRVEQGKFRQPHYTPEFRAATMRLVAELGVKKAARITRIPLQTLYQWRRKAA